jgi:hypothetical protein
MPPPEGYVCPLQLSGPCLSEFSLFICSEGVERQLHQFILQSSQSLSELAPFFKEAQDDIQCSQSQHAALHLNLHSQLRDIQTLAHHIGSQGVDNVQQGHQAAQAVMREVKGLAGRVQEKMQALSG